MMNRLPLVSIVVPMYNVEHYIEKSISSICKQNYPNIEVIVIDDGSKDSSYSIAFRILSNTNIDFQIIQQENSGLPAARNAGLNQCNGKYVCFIDSDDCIDKNHIKYLVELMETNNLEVSFSDYENVIDRSISEECDYVPKIYTQKQLLNFFVKRKPAIHCCSLLVQIEHIKKHQLYFNENLLYGEDVEYMWRLFSTINKIGRNISKTYRYLIRENSIMSSITLQKGNILIMELEKTLNYLKKLYPNNSYYYECAYYRTALGWLHVVCKTSDYVTFIESLNKVSKMNLVRNLIMFPDLRVRILICILMISPKSFYKLLKSKEGTK